MDTITWQISYGDRSFHVRDSTKEEPAEHARTRNGLDSGGVPVMMNTRFTASICSGLHED
jgi:hypothetical protein